MLRLPLIAGFSILACAALAAEAIELRDAALLAGGERVLQNGAGTVRLENARLGQLGGAVPVPEPAATITLAAGIGLLGLLEGRRRRRAQRARGGDRMPKARHMTLSSLSLVVMVGAVHAVSAGAAVPQDVNFSGRLVDDLGDPLVGPVDLDLRIWSAAVGGSLLYAEEHLATPLNSDGGFVVQLGLGGPLSGSFDASLFSGIERHVEVVVDGEVLAPRLMIGSVPWSFIAETADEVSPDAASLQGVMPTGAVLAFAGSGAAPPGGWLLCDGSSLAQVDYPDLFAVIGTQHGGDATSFDLPDYRGRFLRGQDAGAGRDPDSASRSSMSTGGATGDDVGSVQGHALQEHGHAASNHSHSALAAGTHTHSVTILASNESGNGSRLERSPDGTGNIAFVHDTTSRGNHTHSTSSVGLSIGDPTTSGSTVQVSSESRPQNAYVQYIIRCGPQDAC